MRLVRLVQIKLQMSVSYRVAKTGATESFLHIIENYLFVLVPLKYLILWDFLYINNIFYNKLWNGSRFIVLTVLKISKKL